MTDIVFDTVSLPDAIAGVAYEAALAIHGAATALTAASISSGALPTGLAIDGSLPFLRITGTPKGSAVGTATFKVTLTDTAGAVQSGNYTITVHPSGYQDTIAGGKQTVLQALAKQWPAQY